VIIAAGADVNSRSPEIAGGNVPLEEAIENGHYDVAKTLLAAGADVNARCGSGQVPLHKAAILGDERIVQLLLDNGADTHAADYYGTAADWARRGNRGHIADLIDSKAGEGR
jgi:ankyrin repeat protein